MDEDDFDDFGGFEEAEPVMQTEAAVLPRGVQAAPSPWAVFTAPTGVPDQPSRALTSQQQSTVNSQPDLVHVPAQKRPSLEPPFPQDQHPNETASDNVSTSVNNFDTGFDTGFDDFASMLDLPKQAQPSSSGVRSLTEQVLEPHFGSQAPLSAIKPIPDGILDLDLSQVAKKKNTQDYSKKSESGISLDSGPIEDAEPPKAAEESAAGKDSVAVSTTTNSQPAVQSIAESENVRHQNNAASNTVEPVTAAKALTEKTSEKPGGQLEVKLSLAEQEKQRLQEELQELLSRQTQAENQVAKTREELNNLKEQYRHLQKQHSNQLEELRQAGHEALAIIVEEYKDLCRVAVAEQQQAANEKLQAALKEEAEKWQQLAQKQEENLKQQLESEREEAVNKLKTALEEQREQQQILTEKHFVEERQKSEGELAQSIKESEKTLRKDFQGVVESDREEHANLLQKQNEIFQQRVKEMEEKAEKRVERVLQEEQKRCKECIQAAVMEERRSQEAVRKEAVQQIREDMERYLQEQRQADSSVRRRALTSIDLFLDSARQQLQLLLTPETTASDVGRMMDAQAER